MPVGVSNLQLPIGKSPLMFDFCLRWFGGVHAPGPSAGWREAINASEKRFTTCALRAAKIAMGLKNRFSSVYSVCSVVEKEVLRNRSGLPK